MAKCDEQLQPYLAALPRRPPLAEPAAEASGASPKSRGGTTRSSVRKPQGNQPAFEVESKLRRTLGVDATTLDGIDVMAVQTVLAEGGPDLGAWKSERHWSSWLSLAPKRDISGGRGNAANSHSRSLAVSHA